MQLSLVPGVEKETHRGSTYLCDSGGGSLKGGEAGKEQKQGREHHSGIHKLLLNLGVGGIPKRKGVRDFRSGPRGQKNFKTSEEG